MRISIGQIVVLLLIFFLLFGDYKTMGRRLSNVVRSLKNFAKNNNRKKGT